MTEAEWVQRVLEILLQFPTVLGTTWLVLVFVMALLLALSEWRRGGR